MLYTFAGLLGVLGVLFLAQVKPSQPAMRCGECGEGQLKAAEKEPLQLIEGNYGDGGRGGGHSTTSVLYRITYRCTHCGEPWVVTQTETR